jgi:hypothetical protein
LLAVLGFPDTHTQQLIEARIGILQTKVLEQPQNETFWPRSWYSKPMVQASTDGRSEHGEALLLLVFIRRKISVRSATAAQW